MYHYVGQTVQNMIITLKYVKTHTICYVAVVYLKCNPYILGIISPSHLLSGLAKDNMSLCFTLVRSEKQVTRIERRICSMLSEVGLPKQRKLCKRRSKKLFSRSISDNVCVLFVSSFLFQHDHSGTKEYSHAISLLPEFQELIAYTYWYPVPNFGGKYVYFLSGNNYREYDSIFQDIAMRYVTNLN